MPISAKRSIEICKFMSSFANDKKILQSQCEASLFLNQLQTEGHCMCMHSHWIPVLGGISGTHSFGL